MRLLLVLLVACKSHSETPPAPAAPAAPTDADFAAIHPAATPGLGELCAISIDVFPSANEATRVELTYARDHRVAAVEHFSYRRDASTREAAGTITYRWDGDRIVGWQDDTGLIEATRELDRTGLLVREAWGHDGKSRRELHWNVQPIAHFTPVAWDKPEDEHSMMPHQLPVTGDVTVDMIAGDTESTTYHYNERGQLVAPDSKTGDGGLIAQQGGERLRWVGDRLVEVDVDGDWVVTYDYDGDGRVVRAQTRERGALIREVRTDYRCKLAVPAWPID